jgi:hypothetical protein
MALLPPQPHRRKNRTALSAILPHSGDGKSPQNGQLADTRHCELCNIHDGCNNIRKAKQADGKQLFISNEPIYTQQDTTRHINNIHCDIKTVDFSKAELQMTHLENHVTV